MEKHSGAFPRMDREALRELEGPRKVEKKTCIKVDLWGISDKGKKENPGLSRKKYHRSQVKAEK